MTTLFEQIGGAPALHAAVTRFSEKVLADNRISHFFEDVNMARQAAAQERFLAAVLKGTARDPGSYMRRAHRCLVAEGGLGDGHFDAVAEHLAATLSELGVAAEFADEIMSAAAALRDAVLTRDQPEMLETSAWAVTDSAANPVDAAASSTGVRK